MERRFSKEKKVERRRDPRHPIEVTIQLTLGRNATFHATTDLSRGGAFFREAVPFPVGTRARVQFKLPGDAQAFACAGEIVNVPRARLGMGVKFVDLTEDDAVRIDRFAQDSAITNPRGKRP